MNDYKAYIFDLDGTLLDTLDDLTNSVNTALRAYGMRGHSRDEVCSFVGNGVRKLIERAIPCGEKNPMFEQVFKTFREYYLEHDREETHPYPEIMEMLTTLKQRGKFIAVVSNKFHPATKALCSAYFGRLIDVAIGESEHIRKKPAPDSVVEAIRQLGVSAQDCVYVGDSDVDILTAKNSGLPCISVLWGFRKKDFLLTHGATCLIASPLEILKASGNSD